jgi:alkyl hydroperoxide reductase subunit AhpC
MAEIDHLTEELATAKRLVDLLEQDGYGLESAVWVVDEEGSGRLYLVPRKKGGSDLQETIRVAHTISAHKEELPARHDVHYSIVESQNPIIQAINSSTRRAGKVRGIFKNGTYIDTAYILRPAA